MIRRALIRLAYFLEMRLVMSVKMTARVPLQADATLRSGKAQKNCLRRQ
jgi:hypothetical protein